jgi:hypothetical protein
MSGVSGGNPPKKLSAPRGQTLKKMQKMRSKRRKSMILYVYMIISRNDAGFLRSHRINSQGVQSILLIDPAALLYGACRARLPAKKTVAALCIGHMHDYNFTHANQIKANRHAPVPGRTVGLRETSAVKGTHLETP